MKKIEIFKIEGDKITRMRRHCPKCGTGVFLAEHQNRFSCGHCGYTEFKSGGKPKQEEESAKPVSEVKEEVKTPAEEKADKPAELA